MRVAVYAIALNEIGFVARFLAACAGADCVMVADTGSTDGTTEALRRGGAITHAIAVRPWRFDDARNAALALVPADIDVCLALDLDEVLSPGWRAALERGWTAETTLGRYRYVTSHRPDGSAGVVISGAKIHCRFGYRWRYMCHELLAADRIATPCETWLPDLQVDHWPDPAKSRADYLPLLEAAVAEAPGEPRHLFLLGRQYVHLRRWAEGEAVLRRYLALPNARWKLQRATAWRRIARCRNALGHSGEAVAALQEGLRIAPEGRDLWLDLAELHAERQEWAESFAAAQRGLALELVPGSLGNDQRHAGGWPFHRASLAAARLGRGAEAQALALAAEAVAREPGNAVFRRHWEGLGG